MVKINKTNDALTLKHQLKPILETSMFATSQNGCPSELYGRKLSPYLTLSWGHTSHLTGAMKSQKELIFEIPLENYQIFIDSNVLSSKETPLHIILNHCNRLTYFAMREKYKFVRLIVDKTHFSFLYEKLTNEEFDEHLFSSFLKFKSADLKKQFLKSLLTITTQTIEKNSVKELEVISEKILTDFIRSLSKEKVTSNTNYCNALATRAVGCIFVASYDKLSLRDICEKLNATSRSLQQGFTRIYGMGFIEYHKLYRFHKLREHLHEKGLRFGQLTYLMGMYGFTHAGRFSEDYKKIFGKLPSQEKKQDFQKSIFLD